MTNVIPAAEGSDDLAQGRRRHRKLRRRISPGPQKAQKAQTSGSGFPYESFVFQLGGAEVQEQSAAEFGRSEIVDDLGMVCGTGHRTRFDLEDDLIKADEVDSILASERPTFVFDWTGHLRLERNAAQIELNREGILVEDLEEPRAKDAVDFVSSANDGEGSWVLRGRRDAEHGRVWSNPDARMDLARFFANFKVAGDDVAIPATKRRSRGRES